MTDWTKKYPLPLSKGNWDSDGNYIGPPLHRPPPPTNSRINKQREDNHENMIRRDTAGSIKLVLSRFLRSSIS